MEITLVTACIILLTTRCLHADEVYKFVQQQTQHPNELTENTIRSVGGTFDRVNFDLESLKAIFATNEEPHPSRKRSRREDISETTTKSPLGTRPKCSVSKERLSGITKEINKALSDVSKTEAESSNCEQHENITNNCNEMISLIQCGVNHLKNGFLQAVAAGSSLGEISKLKNAYDSLSEKYENDIDNLRRSVSQEYEVLIDNLKTDSQKLAQSLSDSVSRLTKTTLELCTSEISSGKIEAAMEYYTNFQEELNLHDIVKAAYMQYGKLDQVKNIMNFIKLLPSCNYTQVALPALYDAMSETENLDSPLILALYPEVENCVNSTDLKEKLVTHSENVIKAWAHKIKSGDKQQIYEFADKFIESTKYHLPNLVQQTYADNLTNAELTILFVRDLPYWEHILLGFTTLLEAMDECNHLRSEHVLIFNYNLNNNTILEDRVQNGSLPKEFHSLKKKLSRHVNNFIETWAYKIRQKDTYEIRLFDSNQESSSAYHMGLLIDNAYAKRLDNAEVIIGFLNDLPRYSSRAVGFSSLYNNMQINDHLNSYQLLMFANSVKNTMQSSNYSPLDQRYKNMLQTVKNKLPYSVRNLIWSDMSSCTIKNRYFSEYLYTATGGRDYWIYTWVPGNADDDAYWNLHMQDGGKYFFLENTWRTRLLDIDSDKHNDKSRIVHTQSFSKSSYSDYGSEAKWRIIPDGEDSFLLLNIQYSDYIFADGDKRNSDRRYVFGWVPGNIPDYIKAQRKWIISC